MKALIIIDSDTIADETLLSLRPLGFEPLRYRDPIKAIDNLEELEPDLVICSTEDYPRHWKPLFQILRSGRTKDKCVLILLKGEHFSVEEAAKASYIGINGILGENLADPREREQLTEIIKRYFPVTLGKVEQMAGQKIPETVNFIFTDPATSCIIPGSIVALTSESIGFKPAIPQAVSNLKEGDSIPLCSLKIGSLIGMCECGVLSMGNVIGLEFRQISSSLSEALEMTLREPA